MTTAYVKGVGLTPFGRLEGSSALGLQARAAQLALSDAGVHASEVDGVLVGYATTFGHIMPANVLSEQLGIRPKYAFGVSIGGATGLGMLAEATRLVRSGDARTVLVVGGENRATGQSSDTTMATLAQVGHAEFELPVGATIPAYYALLAARYYYDFGLDSGSLAPLAVQMRANAAKHEGAHHRTCLTDVDVQQSRIIASPLRLLECCPVSDGGCAFVVSSISDGRAVAVTGLGQANFHQHVSEADFTRLGAGDSSREALAEAGLAGVGDIQIAGIYDSFTITLALLLEEIGFASPGTSGALAAAGNFASNGALPLNLHGGLLSYGHSGVAGGMAHLAEVVTQLRGEAGNRQATRQLSNGLVHADGGVLSAHVTAVLEAPEFRHRDNVSSFVETCPQPPQPTKPLTVHRCERCDEVWYFNRQLCPKCSGDRIIDLTSSGIGTVFSVSVVHRAPGGKAPYAIALVDLDEGIRVMARVPIETAIGSAVSAVSTNDAYPYFERSGL